MMTIFNKIPKVEEILQKCCDEESLREYFNNLFKDKPGEGNRAYKLLTYIFATNRITIRELKESERVPTNPPDYFSQYILTSHDPTKERIFQ